MLILYLTFLLATDYKILEIEPFCCWKINVKQQNMGCSEPIEFEHFVIDTVFIWKYLNRVTMEGSRSFLLEGNVERIK